MLTAFIDQSSQGLALYKRERDRGQKKTFEEIMAGNFQNLIKGISLAAKMLNEPRAV